MEPALRNVDCFLRLIKSKTISKENTRAPRGYTGNHSEERVTNHFCPEVEFLCNQGDEL